MRAVIVALVLIGFFRPSSQNCNRCDLTGYYNATTGYHCIPSGADVYCTCPTGRAEFNKPCRLCSNSDSTKDVCSPNSGKLIQCIEHNTCGTSYYCLCTGATPGSLSVTLDADCDLTNTLNCPAATGGAAAGPPCLNGGVRVDSICHCPAGFAGVLCEYKSEFSICPNIRCKNNGFCAVHNPTGPYEAVCRCRAGTWGEYCHLNGTVGSCSSTVCLNGGACQENVVGSTRYVYCLCQPGFKGTKCDDQYFTCTQPGKFDDKDMHDQSGYFECTKVGTAMRIQRRACPKGLRFNETRQLCTY